MTSQNTLENDLKQKADIEKVARSWVLGHSEGGGRRSLSRTKIKIFRNSNDDSGSLF